MAATLFGLGRAIASPRLVVWLWLINLLAAVPVAVIVEESLAREIGSSAVADSLREGFDLVWYGEVAQRDEGVEATFQPGLVGLGAPLQNLDDWLSGRLFTRSPELLAIGVGYALLWMVLLGGVLEQHARPTPGVAISRILASGGRFFFRFARLATLSAGLYALVYLLARRLFPWIERATRDVTVEKTVLAYHLLAALLIAGLLLFVRLVFDFAKIAIVVEERRSALLAALAGLSFALRHPLRTSAVVAAYTLLGAALLALYALAAPGPGQAGWGALVGAFAGSQLFLAAKLLLRVALLGAETALYRDRRRGTLPPPL